MAGKKAVRAIVLNGKTILAMERNKFGMEYYTLIGGGIDLGEEPEEALRRELREETGLEVGDVRLVFVEDAGAMYGEQYVYLCEYKGGQPKLDPSSIEAILSAKGQNTYRPVWLSPEQIQRVTFRSSSVREALLDAMQHGFPDTPQRLAWKD